MKAAIISEETGVVTNVIELELDSEWAAPSGSFIRFDENARIGMVWNGSEIVAVEDE